jgi:signal transduction histidine kinase
MNEAIHRADSIILGLLDFSVPHALNQHPENLNAIIEQSLGLVRHEIENNPHPIQVLSELSETLPPVLVDRNKMKQAFVNLLTNAVHAMPNGGQLILHSLSRPLQPGELDRDAGSRLAGRFRAGDPVVVVEIVDTGSGISEDKLERVFDPFFTTKREGTGLGLAICHGIVQRHEGEIDIVSEVGRGTRVVVRLPLL